MKLLQRFFDIHLKPNHEEWLLAPLDERLAMNTVAAANNMAAWALHYWCDRDGTKVYGCSKKEEGKYRRELATRECWDFELVQDIAEAHKHFELDRGSRQLTHSQQTGPGSMGWGEGRFGEGVWGGGPQLVITLDNGKRRPLTSVVKNVVNMWDVLLRRWGL